MLMSQGLTLFIEIRYDSELDTGLRELHQEQEDDADPLCHDNVMNYVRQSIYTNMWEWQTKIETLFFRRLTLALWNYAT